MTAVLSPATGLDPDPWALPAVLAAADDAGILDLLADQPAAAEEVSRLCSIDPTMAALLLDALVAAGTATPAGDGAVAVTSDPTGFRARRRQWATLPEVLRSGHPRVDVSDPAAAAREYGPLADDLAGLGGAAHQAVVDELSPIGGQLLDVGAGAAPWSRALAAANPDLAVTAVDLPGVIDVARRRAGADGLGRRFRCVEGDLFAVELGTGYDLVVVANVCRLFDPTTNSRLLARAAGALRPGGTLAVLDTLPDADRHDGHTIALYALGLALRTTRGGVAPFSSYAGWLYGAGLVDIELTLLPTPHLSLIRATRPD